MTRGMPCDAPGCDVDAVWYLRTLVDPVHTVALCVEHARYVLEPDGVTG